jgi:hypothetical protein
MCSEYVQKKYFNSLSECKKTIQTNLNKCLDTKSYIKSEDGNLYTSLHGRVEANQDVREICAWQQTDDKLKWWDFILAVNKNCNYKNADTCWQEQAKQAGFDTNKITDCFDHQAIAIIEKELKETEEHKVSGSPTLLINGTNFPPESAYTKDGKGSLKIAKKIIPQSDYRTPNAIKEALCSAFKKAPKQCKKTLDKIEESSSSEGGC